MAGEQICTVTGVIVLGESHWFRTLLTFWHWDDGGGLGALRDNLDQGDVEDVGGSSVSWSASWALVHVYCQVQQSWAGCLWLGFAWTLVKVGGPFVLSDVSLASNHTWKLFTVSGSKGPFLDTTWQQHHCVLKQVFPRPCAVSRWVFAAHCSAMWPHWTQQTQLRLHCVWLAHGASLLQMDVVVSEVRKIALDFFFCIYVHFASAVLMARTGSESGPVRSEGWI